MGNPTSGRLTTLQCMAHPMHTLMGGTNWTQWVVDFFLRHKSGRNIWVKDTETLEEEVNIIKSHWVRAWSYQTINFKNLLVLIVSWIINVACGLKGPATKPEDLSSTPMIHTYDGMREIPKLFLVSPFFWNREVCS